MKHKIQRIGIYTTALIMLSQNVLATQEETKQTLKSNGELIYKKAKSVESFGELFSEGEVYARLRSHTFYFGLDNTTDTQQNNIISGLGASVVYKSALYNNFDFGFAGYGSYAFFDKDTSEIDTLKPGHDLVSRYNYVNYGDRYMAVIGQAYLRYGNLKTARIAIGRQIVETFYTKSNDTKMIPNTFDGLVLDTNAMSDSSIKVAYLTAQKLRDHTTAHSILMYGDANSSSTSVGSSAKWSENDDSAMHKGLTYTALKAAGKPTDAPLITGDLHNRSVENLKADASFYVVPKLLGQVMLEGNYQMKMDGFSVTPGVRYIKQADYGAGVVGGASYTGDLTGYKNSTSLNAQMIAARVVTQVNNYKLNIGYSNVLDQADLITPWRGFPTAGYTRSMARYNWRANTKGYRAELTMNDNKSGVYKDVYVQTSVLYTDADESKKGVDEMYYYLGFIQNLPVLPELQWRLRLGYAQYLQSAAAKYNNLDARFELNYLF
jgi:hypothetical protein